jgi:aldehyde dehydrogenase (NAD+)
MLELQTILSDQDTFFKTKKTHSIKYRKEALVRLKKAIIAKEPQILEALYKDLKKPEFEAYSSEIGVVLAELNYFIKNINRLAKPKKVNSFLLNFPSKDYIYSDPFGRVLIMAPWNYPFQLVINPLVAAVAAGNCVVCKPSELTEHTSKVISELIIEVFDQKHVSVIEGGIEVNQYLLKQKWDYIFFTGSTAVGKIVMKAAAEQLCPVTLELGGKSPVIVHKDAKLKLAAKRIIWGKLYNAGQTCIAPDYIYVHISVKAKFIDYLIEELESALGENPQKSKDFARIINLKHYSRINALVELKNIVYGGKTNDEELFIEPTILDNIDWDSKIMKEEIFGPLLPILSFSDLGETIELINEKEKPLAAYYFGENKTDQEYFLKNLYFGGGCINDTLIHITSENLPFGGVGPSGIGNYHGAASFECFSHQKGIVKRGTWMDVPVRYAPYASKLGLIKKLFKYFT